MLRAQFTKQFTSRLPFMDEIIYENLDAPSLTYNQVMNIRDSKRAFEEMLEITGFEQFVQKSEGEPISYDKLLQGYSTRFTHDTFAKGYQISMEAQEDDFDGTISEAAPALGRIARNSIETKAFAIFNGAFDTTTSWDGAFLCADSHTLVGGGTFDNKIASDISQGAIEDAINIFDAMVDERNQLVNMDARILLIPPKLRWITHELLKSQLRSDTANNAVNAINQLGLKVVESKYLTDDDNWFILSDPNQHRIMFYWRMQPRTDHTLDFDTGNAKTKMTMRFSTGAASWRGIVGGLGQ